MHHGEYTMIAQSMDPSPDAFPVIPDRFAGKVAIVTGGASGMGRAQALRLAAEGAAVAILDVDAEGGRATADAIAAAHGTAASFRVDLTDLDELDRALTGADGQFGPPDLLFSNVGTILVKPYDETTEADFDRMMNTNVRSAFMLTRRVIPRMLVHGGGAIVIMSSVSALRGFALEAIYGLTKAAVQSLMMNIAIEYRARAIRCNAVCPAFVQTPHGRREMRAFAELGLAWDEQQLAQTQLRMCDAAGVASVALYLASDEARLVNGVAVPVDNGWMAGA